VGCKLNFRPKNRPDTQEKKKNVIKGEKGLNVEPETVGLAISNQGKDVPIERGEKKGDSFSAANPEEKKINKQEGPGTGPRGPLSRGGTRQKQSLKETEKKGRGGRLQKKTGGKGEREAARGKQKSPSHRAPTVVQWQKRERRPHLRVFHHESAVE